MTITLAELAAQRRAKLDALNAATPGHLGAFETLDLSALNDAIERTPIASKADALAALDVIHDEAAEEPDQHLIISMVVALRSYLVAAV
jgi:hypothetical protein